ncbi:amidase [Streptomyces sp. NPDC050509]|uniref:amidase n=1 Tax=Streptomyces sp. NPDC050509 TaxID=3365620 RepID=UPI0037A37443
MSADATAAVEDALRRAERVEPEIRAWVRLDAEGARTAARQAPDGPLHGLPFGVKDIIDVAGLPTECGSSLRRGHIATQDAWLVERLRQAGAVPLGKTVTTEFAYFRPGPTRNPHNTAHTPGGSSSGSAAAVAAGVVPLALGSQTAGSLTRPASFCGVAGYVAPAGVWPTRGFTGLSPSLDAPGLLTAHVAGLAAVIEAVDGTTPEELPRPPRVVVWSGTDLADIDPAMSDALRTTARALGADAPDTSLRLEAVARPPELASAHTVVMAYEAARALADEARCPEALSGHLNDLLDRGRATSDDEYRTALATARDARVAVLELLDDVDVILGPAAPGPAPHGLDVTGTPVLSRPWQLLGLPVVTVPGHRAPEGMPLGLQLIGHPGRVGRLIGLARLAEESAR